MILVTGATGKIGQEVVSRLAAKGERVRAFVRNPARGAALQGPNVELFQGDLDDPASIARALEGVDAVFLLSNANHVQELSALDQIARSSVKRVVNLSAMGASLESPLTIGRNHAQVEERLRSMPLTWTILRPGMFAQNLLQSADTIRSSGRIFGAYGTAKIAPIDVRDIADVAVAALTEDSHAGKTYALTGPELLDYPAMAAALSTAAGKPITYTEVPLDAVRDGLGKAVAAGHIPAWLADDLVKMQSLSHDRVGEKTDDVARILGRPARPFSDFARDSAAAFRT